MSKYGQEFPRNTVEMFVKTSPKNPQKYCQNFSFKLTQKAQNDTLGHTFRPGSLYYLTEKRRQLENMTRAFSGAAASLTANTESPIHNF